MTYDNACKVIEYINKKGGDNYANVTSGGVSMNVTDEDWPDVEAHIKGMNVRYEIGTEHPEKVTQKIIAQLRGVTIIVQKQTELDSDGGISDYQRKKRYSDEKRIHDKMKKNKK